MPRMRTIKPGFFANDLLAEVGPFGQLLFAGLWILADREGRLEDRPQRIKAFVFPYYDVDVSPLLDALADRGFIVRYSIGDDRYIQVENFLRHQNPHIKEQGSVIPPPDRSGPEMVQETVPEPSSSGAGTNAARCMHSANTGQAPEKHSSCPASMGHGMWDVGHGEPREEVVRASNLRAREEPPPPPPPPDSAPSPRTDPPDPSDSWTDREQACLTPRLYRWAARIGLDLDVDHAKNQLVLFRGGIGEIRPGESVYTALCNFLLREFRYLKRQKTARSGTTAGGDRDPPEKPGGAAYRYVV